jgi:hypothetical protein
VVTASEVGRLLQLLGAGSPLDGLIEQGAVQRSKVEGQWLYHPSGVPITTAQEQVMLATAALLDDWLLGPLPFLGNTAASRCLDPSVSAKATRVLLRELLHQRRLEAVGLLTLDNAPFLAAYRPEDRPEIEAQVAFLFTKAEQSEPIRAQDLPPPVKARSGQAWRTVLLRHGEFLGLGTLRNGMLVPWSAA